MSDLTDDTPTPETTTAVAEPAVSEHAEPEAAVAEAAADSPESVPEPAAVEAGSEPDAAAAEPSAPVPEVEAAAAEDGDTDASEEPAEVAEAAAAEPSAPAAAEPPAPVAVDEADEAKAESQTAAPVAEVEPEAAASSEADVTVVEPAEAATVEPVAVEPEAAAPSEAAAVEPAAKTETEPAAETPAQPAAETPAELAAESPAESAAEPAPGASSSPELVGAMANLAKAMEEKTLVEGQVIGWNKGGYHIAVGKIAAFCPVSQIEIGNPRGPKRYLDKTFKFRVIEIQKGGRRVVLSRSEALKAEREQKAALVRELLKPGAVIEGKISSLTDFGAFVDLGGGIEGLVHVSEISRRRVEHPKEVLKTKQPVKVSVLKIEKGGRRISLSMKRLEPDPWKGVAERFPPGSEFTGTIVRQTDFGLFVEVEPGLEGLVHSSRLGLGMTLEDERLQVGREISGWIHEVEGKRRRLSLSLRKVAGGNPWQGVTERYPVGEVVKGTVEKLASFGAFIELEPGLTGLLPFSVLGSGPGSNPRRQYHAGKEVSVRILAIDRAKRRISLGTEASKAEGNQQDFREYKKEQRAASGGLNAMAAAFAKLKEQERDQAQ